MVGMIHKGAAMDKQRASANLNPDFRAYAPTERLPVLLPLREELSFPKCRW